MTLRAAPWLPLMLCAALAACASRPPVPDWQGSAQGAASATTSFSTAACGRAVARIAAAISRIVRTMKIDRILPVAAPKSRAVDLTPISTSSSLS